MREKKRNTESKLFFIENWQKPPQSTFLRDLKFREG